MLLLSTRVAAEPRQVDLRWDAPQGCPQESDVRGRIQKILGTDRHDTPFRADGAITRVDGRFRLELVLHVGDVTGTRSLAAKSCDDLAGAAAVEIGLLVHSVESQSPAQPGGAEAATSNPATGSETVGGDSSTRTQSSSTRTPSSSSSVKADALAPRGRSEASPPVPEATKTEPATDLPAPTDAEPPQTLSTRAWRVLVQAPTVALGVGPLPGLGVGLGLSLGLEYERWQLQLQGIAWQPQDVPADGFSGYGAHVDRIGARFSVCREIRVSSLGFSPCLAAGMDRVSAEATGANIAPIPQKELLMSLGAGAQARLYLTSRLRMLASVAGEIGLVRPELKVRGLGPIAPPPDGDTPDPPTTIYRFAPAALTATLSLEWSL